MVPRVRRSQTWTSRGSGGGSQTRATLVGGECNRRYGILLPSIQFSDQSILTDDQLTDDLISGSANVNHRLQSLLIKLRQHCERRSDCIPKLLSQLMSGTDDRISTPTVQQSSASLNLHFRFHFHLLLSLLLI